MVTTVFNDVIKAQLTSCQNLLIGKGFEYAPDAMDENDVDRLAHFKKAAVLVNGTPKQALFGMLAKHLISVSDMCTDGQPYTKAIWSEKITDSINYLLLLRALVEEEQNG